jgi:hypothetical protein
LKIADVLPINSPQYQLHSKSLRVLASAIRKTQPRVSSRSRDVQIDS